MNKNKFIVITPFYNAEEWVSFCVRSVKSQQYENYSHHLIDDLSTDNSSELISQEIKGDPRFNLTINTTKKQAIKNIEDTLKEISPNDDDIIVILDGDDWLASSGVFSYLNDVYNKENCWMTYGSYVEYPSNQKGIFAQQIPQEVIDSNSYRDSQWMSSHLRTFRYKLWKHIDPADFIYSRSGNTFRAAWDLAFVFPMLEMCGEKAKYIEDILYVYNRDNPLNEDKVDHPTQLAEEAEVRGKVKYSKLNRI